MRIRREPKTARSTLEHEDRLQPIGLPGKNPKARAAAGFE